MNFFKKIAKKAKTVFRQMKSTFDNTGSYTGTPEHPSENQKPEQDADDL